MIGGAVMVVHGIEITEGESTLRLRQRPWWSSPVSAVASIGAAIAVAIGAYWWAGRVAAVGALVLVAGVAAWSVYSGPHFVEADEEGVVVGTKHSLRRYPWGGIGAIVVEESRRESTDEASQGRWVTDYVPALILDNGAHVSIGLGKSQERAELVRGQLDQFRQRLDQPSRWT